IPDFERLKRYAADQGIDAADNNELVKNAKIQALYRHRIDDLMKDFARFEQIKQFILLPAEFTEASGELTPTLKIKRKVVEKKFAKEIEGLYSKTA
ncbi:MAG: long-chain fatty acid--CoA ligase, partial [Nitrospinota bacterium]